MRILEGKLVQERLRTFLGLKQDALPSNGKDFA